MSNPFTSADAPWQTLLTELSTAWSERRLAIGQEAYTPTEGRDMQESGFWFGGGWRRLYDWLDDYCVLFVDHVNGPLTDNQKNFRMFTRDTWRAAAGLPSGYQAWRRAQDWAPPADPVWLTPGLMREGDIIGPWIFEDLQKGFGTLRWTPANGTWTNQGENNFRSVTSAEYFIWNQAKAHAESLWDAAGNAPNDRPGPARYSWTSYPIVWHTTGLHSEYAYPKVLLSAHAVPRAVESWLQGSKVPDINGEFDAQGDGLTEELALLDALEATASAIDFTYPTRVGQIPANGVYPTWMDAPSESWAKGYVGLHQLLLKWSFTNA